MVDPTCHDKWYELLTQRLIPMMADEGFSKYLLTRVLHDDPSGHHTYSLQVDLEDIPAYQHFMENIIGEYAEIAPQLFGEAAMYFTTLLKKIEL